MYLNSNLFAKMFVTLRNYIKIFVNLGDSMELVTVYWCGPDKVALQKPGIVNNYINSLIKRPFMNLFSHIIYCSIISYAFS
jgi:restriction endonuclease S subunit